MVRCSCPECGTYMVHSEGLRISCVCPDCGARCDACLGTNTVIPREMLREWAKQRANESNSSAPEESD